MKLKVLFFLIFLIVVKTFSQSDENILFTIDEEPYYTDEFLRTYQKNKTIVQDINNSTIVNYLDLFVNYKLKVKSAKDLGLDTLASYKNELEQYRNSLVLPYLKDEKVTNNLVKEAYNRLLKEINASHILIFVKEEDTAADTLAAYNKIMEARNLIVNGRDFAEVAKQYSQDQSVQQNGGKIGYFTVLQLVYPFENVAYTTNKGEVSMPFRTKFGYHILKVNDIRDSEGEVEVAHIMIGINSENAEERIDAIYNELVLDPTSFESIAAEVSEDNASATSGGKLRRFSAGQMVDAFSDVAFSLQTVGDISKPFQTQYGWHIVKLLQKYPIESFEELEPELLRQVENDDRSNLIGKSVVDKLYMKYNVKVNEEALNQFNIDDWKNAPEKFQKNILTIESKELYQSDFINYLKTVGNELVKSTFDDFKDNEVLNYYKENIQFSNPTFAATYKEFEEGLLLFEMLEREVWEKSKDSIGLLSYYNTHKTTDFKDVSFEENKGVVIANYQNYIEQNWIKSLREKYKVVINQQQKQQILETKLD